MNYKPNAVRCDPVKSKRRAYTSATRVFNFRVETLQRRTPKRRGKATHPYLLLRESMESSFHSCLLMKIERSRERGEEGRVPLTRAQSVRNRKKLPWNAFNARQSRIKYSSSPSFDAFSTSRRSKVSNAQLIETSRKRTKKQFLKCYFLDEIENPDCSFNQGFYRESCSNKKLHQLTSEP